MEEIDRPIFVFNIKCVFFSLLVMLLLFSNAPKLKSWKLYLAYIVTFFLAYIAMAWYDYYYNCDIHPLKRGTGPTTQLKPPIHSEKQITRYFNPDLVMVYMFHLLFVVPLVLFIAIYGKKSPKSIFYVLLALGILTLLYHGTQAFYYFKAI